MNAPNPKFYKQDEDGQWWYYPWRDRPRTRAKIKTCEHCEQEYVINAYNYRKSRFCSRECSGRAVGAIGRLGADHPAWRGGRNKTGQGYIRIYQPEHHSREGKVKRYVLEHRLVMEQAIGRPLLESEYVHHVNGVRDDNRPENLELWTRRHPVGVRVGDAPHCATCTCGANHEVGALKLTAAA